MTTALICGVSGQTGAYLARSLVDSGVRVVGTSRDSSEANLWRLKSLNVLEDITLTSLSLHDSSGIKAALDHYAPDQIFYLAGPSSVAASFREPLVAMDQIFQPVITFLEELKNSGSQARFVNAASTDCFGNQPGVTLTESSMLQPVSPYAVAKTAGFWSVKNYRESFGVNASNGILTNHESPLRGPDFVTQKIITGLRQVAEGKRSSLSLGDTSVSRDWLWAGDVVHAISLISSAPQADDYLVASGQSSTLHDFINLACEELGLDSSEVITQDPSLVRPSDIRSISLDSQKIRETLGWRPTLSLRDIIVALLSEDVGPHPKSH